MQQTDGQPSRWLLKNTDSFAGFAHAMNSYLSGVALAARHGVGLLHRPQQMAHGLGFAFVDFFDSDPRGVIPPVYAPTLSIALNSSAMLINHHPVQFYVQLAAAGNSSLVRRQLDALPRQSILWLRKGRHAFYEPDARCIATANAEACYTALWLRERFWRAVLARREAAAQMQRPIHGKARLHLDLQSVATQTSNASGTSDEGTIRVCIHVRRGDVYYLGPKTRLPHPHWVDSATVMDILIGVRTALGRPLKEPAVVVDLFSERGWLQNDTAALRMIAPNARVHLDSSPAATVDVLIRMSMADVLIMGSSGFSFWAGIFSCGVKIGYINRQAEPLPMRFVKYASTITTRSEPFWPAAGEAFRHEWSLYWNCRVDPACRRNLCAPRHLYRETNSSGSIWTRSGLAQDQIANAGAVQWRLPGLVLWPEVTRKDGRASTDASIDTSRRRKESPALAEMRQLCMNSPFSTKRKKAVASSSIGKPDAATVRACVRNQWLHNLTAFLAARRKVRGGVITVGSSALRASSETRWPQHVTRVAQGNA
jgi:hypothetical protein